MAAAHPRKLDLPLSQLQDDWDLLQAAFECYIAEIGRSPGIEPNQILAQEFPVTQSKTQQETRLKRMLSQRNEWGYTRKPSPSTTPPEILRDALGRIQAEAHLSQQKTVRQLLMPYLETSTSIPNSSIRSSQPVAWTAHFRGDFWEYVADLKIQGQTLLPQPEASIKTKRPLQPGEERTLMALKKVHPAGLTAKELCKLTRKDQLAEETPRGSQDPWLKHLKDRGLIKAAHQRPQYWYFVTDVES